MRIDFESSGGFAGLQLEYRVDTSDIPSDLAEELHDLVEQSGVFQIDPRETQPSVGGPPDVMTYRLSVTQGGRRISLTCTDITAPPSLQSLLSRLRQLSLRKK